MRSIPASRVALTRDRSKANQPDPNARMLLALEGPRLDATLLRLATTPCRELCRRVDILVVSPPKPPTMRLARLLRELENAASTIA